MTEMSLGYWHILFGALLCIISTIWLYYKLRKKPLQYTCEDVLGIIQNAKIFPVEPGQNWRLFNVFGDHRIWETHLTLTNKSGAESTPLSTYGCYSKVKGSSQTVLKLLTDTSAFPSWRTSPCDVVQVSTSPDTADSLHSQTVSAKTKHSDTSPAQSDVIRGRDVIQMSKCQAIVTWISNRTKRKRVDHYYEIQRVWNKEDNGCCWLLEMKPEQREWMFYLAQPVEKWFEIDQCLLTVLHCPNKAISASSFRIPAEFLSGIHNYIVYQKVQCAPLLSVTINNDVIPNDAQESEPRESPASTTAAPSKARTIFEDVISKFSKPPEDGKSEPKFLTKFRNLIEEKKEWYEEKKRKAATKSSESTDRAKEEVDSILEDHQDVKNQSDSEHENSQDDEPFVEAPKVKRKLVKSKTIDWVGNADTDSDVGDEPIEPKALKPVSSSPSFGEKIKRRLMVEMQRRRSLDSSLTSSDEHKIQGATLQNVKENIELAREDDTNNCPDMETAFIELGKETCAQLLSMKSKISNIDIKLPYDQQAAKSGGWIYCGLEREVVILRKIYEEGGPVQSYLGKGVIPCPPKAVFETLSNPRTRFTYDEMLKKMDIVHEFPSGPKIIHWYHEVSQLFKRECRDFCVLQHDHIEGSKYVISLQSVAWPGCPEKHDTSRAKLHASGWIIEPAPKNNQLHSMVTYIIQMELGHSKTNSAYLVEELAAKQPLSIAFLRQYLVPTSTSPRSTGTGSRSGGSTSTHKSGEASNYGSRHNTLATMAAQFQSSSDKREILENPPITC